METTQLILNYVFLFVSLIVPYLLKKNVPKEINPLFGYRSRRSMASKEAWDFANHYWPSLLLNYSIGCSALHVILYFIWRSPLALLISIAIWFFMLIATIIQTENKLKNEYSSR